MGPKGRPDTKTNWSTVCQPQEELRTPKPTEGNVTQQRDVSWFNSVYWSTARYGPCRPIPQVKINEFKQFLPVTSTKLETIFQNPFL
jgi:hypothetical protein